MHRRAEAGEFQKDMLQGEMYRLRECFFNTLQKNLGAHSEKSSFCSVIVLFFYIVYCVVCYVWIMVNLTPEIVLYAVLFIFYVYLVIF